RRSERKWPSSDAPDCGSHNSVFNCVDLRVRPLARGVGDPGAKTGWAAGRRLSASRDWPKSDKSIYSSCRHRLAWRARSFSPFLWNQRKLPYACSSMVIKREFLPTVNPEGPTSEWRELPLSRVDEIEAEPEIGPICPNS